MITSKYLRQILEYDPETGVFRWKEKTSKHSNVEIGSIAGFRTATDYIFISILNKEYAAHRLAWLYVHDEWPSEFIDHINGVKYDNKISNLREASHSENQWNHKIRKDNRSGFKGVSYNKKSKSIIKNLKSGKQNADLTERNIF